jgi:hypothetical protein
MEVDLNANEYVMVPQPGVVKSDSSRPRTSVSDTSLIAKLQSTESTDIISIIFDNSEAVCDNATFSSAELLNETESEGVEWSEDEIDDVQAHVEMLLQSNGMKVNWVKLSSDDDPSECLFRSLGNFRLTQPIRCTETKTVMRILKRKQMIIWYFVFKRRLKGYHYTIRLKMTKRIFPGSCSATLLSLACGS